MLRVIDITAADAEDTLVLLARHVPRDVELGRPMVVKPHGDSGVLVLSDLCLWTVRTEQADRLLQLSGGRVELSSWRDGREVSRSVHGGE